jgi:hypothetical protein
VLKLGVSGFITVLYVELVSLVVTTIFGSVNIVYRHIPAVFKIKMGKDTSD